MRRSVALVAVALLVTSIAACDSGFWDMPGIDFYLDGPGEFALPQEQVAMPFTAEGWHVDQEDICANGTATLNRLESVNSETLTSEEWAEVFNTAMEAEGTAEAYLFLVFECGDGSGSFSMEVHVVYDFAAFEFGEGELDDFASWQILEGEGTGSYLDLSGNGDIEIHWDVDEVRFGGEVFP